MENNEVAFEIVDEVELHLSELGVVRWKGFDAVLFTYPCCQLDEEVMMYMLNALPNKSLASVTTFLMCTGDSSAFAAT